MMKETKVLYLSRYLVNGSTPKNGRGVPQTPFPYIGMTLALKNKVSRSKNKSNSSPCLFEMSNLLSCLQETEFNEKLCLEQKSQLKSCEEKFLATIQEEEKIRREGTLIPGAKTLSGTQVNILLKKYPQPDIKK